MIVVRTVFQASFGRGGELAATLRSGAERIGAEMGGDRPWRLLTDLSGSFDTIVQEVEVESLAEWEAMRARLFATSAFRESMAATQGMIVSGRNELWTIEARQ
jgi:hypothetical protein